MSDKTSWIKKLRWPEVKACNGAISAENAVIISAAGFEDRTLAFSSQLAATGCLLGLARYKDWEKGNREDDIVAWYTAAGVDRDEIYPFEYDRFDPDHFGDDLELWLGGVRQFEVFVDISTMSRLAIMIILDVCRRSGKRVRVYYAEANEYGPTREQYENARKGIYPRPSVQVYSGLGGVVRSSRLSSVALQGEPTALIAFMSMNEVLTQALINCISPSRLLLINGRPPHHAWREEATAWIHDALRREWPIPDNPRCEVPSGAGLPERVTSTLDYTETVNALLDLYWSCAAEFRIVLAPTGSKMQTVACFLAKAVHTDIHIEYPTPEGFLGEYSCGIGNRWLIDFGRLQESVEHWRTSIVQERLMIIEGANS